MAAAPPNISAEKPQLFDYYFQIPEKAEVKKVPISMLSSSVRQRILHLDGRTNMPYVIIMSPIIMQKLPNSHNAKMTVTNTAAEHCQANPENQSLNGRSSADKADKWTGKGHGTYLVPVRCCKETALTILQLAQTEETLSLENELQTFSDFLVPNLPVVKMDTSALCMYNNVMYLLPESKNTNVRGADSEAWEKVEKSGTPALQEESVKRGREIVHKSLKPKIKEQSVNREQRHEGLDHRRPVLQQQSCRLEVGTRFVNLWNENRWNQPAEMSSTSVSPSSSSSTDNSQQISFWEDSEKQSKRKLESVGKQETFIKRLHLSRSDIEQNPPAAKNVFTSSPPHPYLSSSRAPSPLGPQESPSSSTPANSPPNGKTTDLDELSSSSLLCNMPPYTAPASPGLRATRGNNRTLPCLEVQPSPSSSDFTTSENSNEPNETASSSEPSNPFRCDQTLLLDIDDTTRDERTQRLLDRVRELDKIVEDIR
ncbi:hypothetical protein PRIEUP_LOCUS1906, partial [Pristimantis euphronides]